MFSAKVLARVVHFSWFRTEAECIMRNIEVIKPGATLLSQIQDL